MGMKCKECGGFVEPTEEAMETGICGYCSGDFGPDTLECFDGSPCTESHQNCNKCKWMGGEG